MTAEKDEAATIQRAGELRAQRLPLRKIAEILEKEGYPPAGNRSKWHHAGVRWCLDRLDGKPPPTPARPPKVPQEEGEPALHIEVHGRYTRSDRLLWDFLVQRAWPTLANRMTHTLPLPVVYGTLEAAHTPPTRRQLWEALQRLAATRIVWDGKAPPRRNSTVVGLLTGQIIDDKHLLLFHFSPFLVTLLLNHKQNARLRVLLEAKKH